MHGPEILARTMSVPTRSGRGKKAWQYHSQSDRHSKQISWTILFDLLVESDAFQQDAAQGKIAMALKHALVGPIDKAHDLVVCRVPPTRTRRGEKTFQDLAKDLEIQLTDSERNVLQALPPLQLEAKDDVSEVVLVAEIEICMTAHEESLPRVHNEFLAAACLVKQAAPHCITASYTLVNSAPYFISPGTKSKRNVHSQPNDTTSVLQMLKRGIPLRSMWPAIGYDAVGASVIDCRNDGSDIVSIRHLPAPKRTDWLSYTSMISMLCSAYHSRYGARVSCTS